MSHACMAQPLAPSETCEGTAAGGELSAGLWAESLYGSGQQKEFLRPRFWFAFK